MNIEKLSNKIADKTLLELGKEGIFIFPENIIDADDITKNQMILKSYNQQYRTGNVAGYLGLGSERLIINSRFTSSDKDYFFQYLLEKVVDIPNVLSSDSDSNNDNRFLELLIFMFPYYLRKAFRKGLYRTYVLNGYNDENVKGSIDITRHIKKNTPFIGRVAYNQRELSHDNYLMEIVRHTIEFIKQKPYGKLVLGKVKFEVVSTISATEEYRHNNLTKIINENKKKPIRHAYYQEYRMLQRLCLMILNHDKHQLGSGDNQINGILFDCSWLWEEYVNLLIGDRFYHPMNKGGKGAQQLFSKTGGKIGLIYPDFLSKNQNERVVVDAKYKPSDNISNKDYLQILAYMYRFDAKKGYYIYPEKGEDNYLSLYLNQGSSYENNVIARNDVRVEKCGLSIPAEVSSYAEFVQKIHDNENIFCRGSFWV